MSLRERVYKKNGRLPELRSGQRQRLARHGGEPGVAEATAGMPLSRVEATVGVPLSRAEATTGVPLARAEATAGVLLVRQRASGSAGEARGSRWGDSHGGPHLVPTPQASHKCEHQTTPSLGCRR